MRPAWRPLAAGAGAAALLGLTACGGGSNTPPGPSQSLRSAAVSLQEAMDATARAIDGVRPTRESLERAASNLGPQIAQTSDVIGSLAAGEGAEQQLLKAARDQRTFLQFAVDGARSRSRRAADSALTRGRDAGRRASTAYAQIAQTATGLAGLLPASTTFNSGRLRDAVRQTNQPHARPTGGAPAPARTLPGAAPPVASSASVFSGTWTGLATQFAPAGSTQRVSLATVIDTSGQAGTHAEFINGARRTNDCRGTLRRIGLGVYEYRERADSGCIASTIIRLRRVTADELSFRESYSTNSGGQGTVIGTLTRRR